MSYRKACTRRLMLLVVAALALGCRPGATTNPPEDKKAPPPRMKAARMIQYGGPDVVRLTEVDTPSAGSGQVLVEVHGSSINPVDVLVREGKRQQAVPLTLPVTLGWDVAGVVIALGPGVTSLALGDRVYGQAAPVGGATGGFAEYAVVPATRLARMPQTVGFTEAGALPVVGTTALQGIKEHMKLQSGQKVLIHGGGGGVGSMAIQIAKHLGAHVATTATGDDLPYVKSLGADVVIDYRTQRFEDLLSGYDAVFDTVGGDTYDRSFQVLRKGGVIVSTTHRMDPALAEKYGVMSIAERVHSDTASLTELAALVDAGVVKVNVDQVFPLSKIEDAFRAREQSGPGKIRGKVAVAVRP
jgi:NADPH:quinone reductase-like Zn-dependent oxidoreductase